jgi:hypothetical protein
MTVAERQEFEFVLSEWQRKLGAPIELADPAAEDQLVARLAALLGPPRADRTRRSELARCLTRERLPPQRDVLPLPDMRRVTSGHATRDDAEKWLAIQEQILADRWLLAGLEPDVRTPPQATPEERVLYLLTALPAEAWSAFLLFLRPLINGAFCAAIKRNLGSDMARRRPGKLSALLSMATAMGIESPG